MEKWQTGDVPSFEAFFRDYQKVVFHNAYLITGNRQDAEDVLQDVFASVWKSRHTFDPEKGKLSTWLHRITVNECMRKKRKSLQGMDIDEIDLPDAGKSTEEQVMLRFDRERLVKAINSLDVRLRAVLVLRYFNDLSYEEIAAVVGIPVGTVKSRINHGLKALRSRLDAP